MGGPWALLGKDYYSIKVYRRILLFCPWNGGVLVIIEAVSKNAWYIRTAVCFLERKTF